MQLERQVKVFVDKLRVWRRWVVARNCLELDEFAKQCAKVAADTKRELDKGGSHVTSKESPDNLLANKRWEHSCRVWMLIATRCRGTVMEAMTVATRPGKNQVKSPSRP